MEAVRCQGQEPARVVYLNQSRNWNLFPALMRAKVRPLAREIVRQAFLMAARDELGLVTARRLAGRRHARRGQQRAVGSQHSLARRDDRGNQSWLLAQPDAILS